MQNKCGTYYFTYATGDASDGVGELLKPYFIEFHLATQIAYRSGVFIPAFSQPMTHDCEVPMVGG
eukprot:scaffold79615_cov63-Phaeocystis_antarctica.AAC.1